MPPRQGQRPIRIAKNKVRIVDGPFRTTTRCTDPFHNQPVRVEGPPRGRLGHHPDLRQLRDSLSRALQGKDRR